MITVKYGDTKILGNKEEIFADLSSIASYAYENLAKKITNKKTFPQKGFKIL